jgi:hypothetical protein
MKLIPKKWASLQHVKTNESQPKNNSEYYSKPIRTKQRRFIQPSRQKARSKNGNDIIINGYDINQIGVWQIIKVQKDS